MAVWEVLCSKKESGDYVVAGTLHAPDLEMALFLATEVFLRHGEGARYAVRLEGTTQLHEADNPDRPALDRSYRTPQGYPKIGAKHAALRARLGL